MRNEVAATFAAAVGGDTTLAASAADGVLASGALPVMKHMPGHGRAQADSHFSLPDVEAPLSELQSDFAPFRALAGLPMGMTAHVRYAAIDTERPGTLSPAVIRLIREEIGFGGFLMSDDISMGALGGKVADNAYRFHPFIVGPADISTVHGTNEKLSVDNLMLGTGFYMHLLTSLAPEAVDTQGD